MRAILIGFILLASVVARADTVFLPGAHPAQTGYYQVLTDDQVQPFTGVLLEVFGRGSVVQIGSRPAELGLILAGWYLPDGTYLVLQSDETSALTATPGGVVVAAGGADGVSNVGSWLAVIDPDMRGDLNVIELHVLFGVPRTLYGREAMDHAMVLRRPNRATADACRPLITFSPVPPAISPCLD